MASRMLHYVIALEVAKIIKIKDINRFMAGALLPDASLKPDGSYMRSHFMNIDKEMGQKTFDWTLFADEYYYYIVSDELYLYPYEALCSYIKESVEVCIHECKALKNGRDLLGAKDYMVTA